jgi:peptidoglycan/xylan/chitin deacetylase (PgdA/CDA1 family)
VRLPVLLYHHVGPAGDIGCAESTLTAATFERQVRWLFRQGYTGIRACDWVAFRRDGESRAEKPVMITFDDAYADVAKHALPIVVKYGFGATVFVVTGEVGRTNSWDHLKGFDTRGLMTAEQIRKWVAQDIEFGAHSRTHTDLTALAPPDLEKEVIGSGSELA